MIKTGRYVWKKMREHVTHANLNASWAQPNPNLPAHIIATN